MGNVLPGKEAMARSGWPKRDAVVPAPVCSKETLAVSCVKLSTPRGK